MSTPASPAHNRIPVNIEDEMKRSYMDYAMSVIIGRALPDIRDGLKPAHRRVLYGMKAMGLSSTRGYRKCAKIVGEVMGNYHPHGDASIYDTLVRMEDEMKRSYMDYAMSVIIGRALPDIRDGLKPAHRRVLYGMKAMGLSSTRGYRKCAKIVGEVMGNYHPHGDASIYDTLVRM